MSALLPIALAVAAVSAIRGVWSPCGLSMLSSITPMTEAGRGNRFDITAAWFVVGAVVGGLTLGAVAAGVAAGIAALDLGVDARYGIAALVATATAAVDLGVLGIELPIFKRQVDDAWLRRYRSWAYGAGFGWQIGVGVATYIMTAGVFLTVALAVLSASPAQALAIGLTFGLVRGSAVYLGRSATTPAALGRVHERLDAAGPTARAAAAAVQVVAAAAFASIAWHPVAGIALVALAAAVVTLGRAGTRPALRP
ncbi:MAG TPA: hypothetical protein VHK88_15435 [Aquihabitans sp.]|jgi:hypothetical protein|nr:hypothetical protein [Aquihabitans sp.]